MLQQQTEEKGSVPTLPTSYTSTTTFLLTRTTTIICSLLLSLDTIGFYVIQKELCLDV